MPLEDLEKIDIVVTSDEGQPILIISDGGVTTDPTKRNELFMQKLGLYVSAIMEGSFNEQFPGASPSDHEIRVVCKNPPSEEMLSVRAVTPKGDRNNAIRVEFEVFGQGDKEPKRIDRSQPTGPELSEDLEKMIDMALSLGMASVKQGDGASGAVVLADGGVSVVMLAGFEDTREAAKQYATRLGPEVRGFAVYFEGAMGVGAEGLTPAVIVEASEWGQEKGVAFGQAFQPKRFLKKFQTKGEKTFLAMCDSYLR